LNLIVSAVDVLRHKYLDIYVEYNDHDFGQGLNQKYTFRPDSSILKHSMTARRQEMEGRTPRRKAQLYPVASHSVHKQESII